MTAPPPDQLPKLYLLDASTYIFRAFHSTQPRAGFAGGLSTSKGLPTNALLVFTNMLRKLVKTEKPDYFACVFDKSDRTFRSELYPAYKGTRSETPPDLVPQFPYFQPIAAGLGLAVLELDGFEADDIIATLAGRAREYGVEAVIVSSDKDLMQLLGSHVRMYDSMKDQWVGLEQVQEKFGVAPNKVVEVQGLIGDTVDNIPGVKGVGPKTASKLIEQYGTLEGVYENLDAIQGKLKERLTEDRASAFLSRELARLRADAPVTHDLESLKLREPNRPALAALFQELEFKTLLREFHGDAQVPAAGTATGTATSAAADSTVITTADALDDLIARVCEAGTCALVVLGSHPEAMRARVVGLGVTVGESSAYVPVGHSYLGAPTQLSWDTVSARLGPVLADTTIRKTVHGAKEAAIMLLRAGVTLSSVTRDTELMSHLVDATRYAHTLENAALDRLDRKLPEPPDDVARGRTTWESATVEHAATVATAWANATEALAGVLDPLLDAVPKLRSLHDTLELPLTWVLMRMEMAGVRIDSGALHGLSERFSASMASLERACHAAAGTTFNLGSPKQLGEVLFGKLGLPVLKKTKTGPSTDASVLEQLAEQSPFVQTILDWREVQKLKGTYTDVLPTLVLADTGRIHTSFRQSVAATGRLSSLDPNLQNIPIRREEGRRIRDAFIAADGHELISADYSQIELRLLAHLSGDPGLCAAFASNEDIHRRTASEVFGVELAAVTREQRSAAKAINFGLMYGMGAFRLARDLGIERGEAARYIARYFERYASVKAFIDQTLERGRELGYVETLLGRRRYVPDLVAKDAMRRQAAERVAVNAPVQGSAADLIKLAMLAIDRRLRDPAEGLSTRMLLQVHDELVLEAPTAEIERVSALVKTEMEGADLGAAGPLRVPLVVEVGHGHHWNEAH